MIKKIIKFLKEIKIKREKEKQQWLKFEEYFK